MTEPRRFAFGAPEGKVRDWHPGDDPQFIVGHECLHDIPCPDWDLVEVEHEDGSTVVMHTTLTFHDIEVARQSISEHPYTGREQP